jgi:hypothetical protein
LALGFSAAPQAATTPGDSTQEVAATSAFPHRPIFHGGIQMGYNMGMNGLGWPNPIVDPLANSTRSGFYMSQAQVQAELPLDSNMAAHASFNAVTLELLDLYVEWVLSNYTITFGKFQGAGLHSLVAVSELERTAIVAPYYARIWANEHRLFSSGRDLGLQLEARHFNGVFTHRLFAHNSSLNVTKTEEPSFLQGGPLQVLGFTYAWDWKLPDHNTVGGHLGALADYQWSEFTGNRDFWHVDAWFQSNPIVDGSLYHAWSHGGWAWNSEVLWRMNRRERNPADGSASQAWGFMTEIQKQWNEKWNPFFRYEFFDPSDGFTPNDNFHLATVGAQWKPKPKTQPGWIVTPEYVVVREEGIVNRVSNDIWYLQSQWTF